MIKRLLEISRHPAHLHLKHRQLIVDSRIDGQTQSRGFPIEDLGVICVDQPQTTYTHQALMELLAEGCALVLCGHDHLPAGMLLPFCGHAEVVQTLHLQITLSAPARKRLWRQIVQTKIRAQAANVEVENIRSHLLGLARRVRSGDSSNIEAQAARSYWAVWLGPNSPFHRDPQSNDSVNGLLNYGYAVLRAAVARALVSAGLQPALGVHHRHRGNPFCLADDLLEPLRPLVDARVRSLLGAGVQDVSTPAKAALLDLLNVTVAVEDAQGPLMVALHRAAASLVRCLENRDEKLLLPLGAGSEHELPESVLALIVKDRGPYDDTQKSRKYPDA